MADRDWINWLGFIVALVVVCAFLLLLLKGCESTTTIACPDGSSATFDAGGGVTAGSVERNVEALSENVCNG